MPTYLRTHPWLKFGLDLDRFPFTLWMLIGEARSKCEHVAGVALQPQEAVRLYHIFLTKGAHATTSIEGNTLSEDEVSRRITEGLPLPRSREYQGKAVDNVVAAVNRITSEVTAGTNSPLSPARICEFNRLLLEGQDLDEDTKPGEIRRHSVGVGRYRGAPHEDCEGLLVTLCDWLNSEQFRHESPEIAFALVLVKAVLAHLYLAWIHPFGDGNGLTARLIEFQWLVESGQVPFPAAHLLSNHFNLTRDRYYRELDRASASGGDFVPFLTYAIEGFVDGLSEQIRIIRHLQNRDLWVNFVHDRFRDQDTPSARRRMHLVLDLPTVGSVTASMVRGLSPRLAVAYAGKGDKTIERDLKALTEAGLVLHEGRRYSANTRQIQAFLPPRAGPRLLR